MNDLNDIIRKTVEPTYRTPVEVYDILLDTTAAYGNPPYEERRRNDGKGL